MSELRSRTVQLLLAIVVLVFSPVALLCGGLWGAFAAVLGLLFLLGWHLYHLQQLMAWLAGPLNASLPRGRGVWEMVFSGLHRRVRIRIGQQQVLSDSLEGFRQAIQALPDGIIAFNRKNHIEWLNERAERYFAISSALDCGQPLTNLIRQPEFVDYLEGRAYEEPFIYRDGRVEGLTLLLQVIAYGKEQSLLVARDISQIERTDTMRRDFIANVSHELKTPLTVVAGFSEMLAEDYGSHGESDVRHYLRLICEQSGRMQRLIEDLLTLSALESGKAPISEERVDVVSMLQGIVSEAESLSAGRHELQLAFEGPGVLYGCVNELRSAFSNLVVNAVRYTPEGGRIAILWASSTTGAALSVTDTGIGIPAEHIPRLTERFYRVDRSRSRETGGTGLGLAIVKHVLTRHHALLEIESEPGKGSRFTARFDARTLAPSNQGKIG